MTDNLQKKLWWAVPAAILLLLTTLAMVFGERPESTQDASSHSAAPRGFRAAYLLLEELGLPVRRSRQQAEGGVRWLLFPNPLKEKEDLTALRLWVERGGILVLAENKDDFARDLGLDGRAGRGTPLLERGGATIATRHDRGAGQVWLIHRPDILRNDKIGEGDNGIAVVRLAELSLAEAERQNRRSVIYFDEFYHGLRERPGVLAILFTPPMHWFSGAAPAFLVLLLWHAVPCFGAIRPERPPNRRSKEEFLDAVAGLLARNRDYGDAFRTARAALLRDAERELGLPAGTPLAQVVQELRARPNGERLASFLGTAAEPTSSAGLVDGLNHLEQARNEFWYGRTKG